jgi:hypothetical protein
MAKDFNFLEIRSHLFEDTGLKSTTSCSKKFSNGSELLDKPTMVISFIFNPHTPIEE